MNQMLLLITICLCGQQVFAMGGPGPNRVPDPILIFNVEIHESFQLRKTDGSAMILRPSKGSTWKARIEKDDDDVKLILSNEKLGEAAFQLPADTSLKYEDDLTEVLDFIKVPAATTGQDVALTSKVTGGTFSDSEFTYSYEESCSTTSERRVCYAPEHKPWEEKCYDETITSEGRRTVTVTTHNSGDTEFEMRLVKNSKVIASFPFSRDNSYETTDYGTCY